MHNDAHLETCLTYANAHYRKHIKCASHAIQICVSFISHFMPIWKRICNASLMHIERFKWNGFMRFQMRINVHRDDGILDVHVMRIENAFRYAHSFRILDAHCIRISALHQFIHLIETHLKRIWNVFKIHIWRRPDYVFQKYHLCTNRAYLKRI